jgi:hypothetical protein
MANILGLNVSVSGQNAAAVSNVFQNLAQNVQGFQQAIQNAARQGESLNITVGTGGGSRSTLAGQGSKAEQMYIDMNDINQIMKSGASAQQALAIVLLHESGHALMGESDGAVGTNGENQQLQELWRQEAGIPTAAKLLYSVNETKLA